MKSIITAIKQKSLTASLLLLLLLSAVKETNAQPPDCVSGFVGYTIFNDSISSSYSGVLDSIEIRPVNLLTGVVGGLMGNRRYWVRKYNGSGSTGSNSAYYYGSSSLAVDFVSGRFYVMTQMASSSSGSIAKDIITINPVGGAMVTVATTPASLEDYHFVKLTASQTGVIYAIGVHWDSSSAAATYNPLVRITLSGACMTAPTTGCATVAVLGYLPSTGLMYKYKLFNGDISFDNSGNLYFATAAFDPVGTGQRYTDSRLFRINAADIPASAGAGTIPMTLVAEYNALDSTVINGIGFDISGNMYLTTRRYLGTQNPPLPPHRSELYRSSFPGSVSLMPAFVRPTAGTSASDLATCYFPNAILDNVKVTLNGQYVSGGSALKWTALSNKTVEYFIIQRSFDGENFEELARVQQVPSETNDRTYTYNDATNDTRNKFYRIKQVMNNGWSQYSNIFKLSGGKIQIAGKIKPNPFTTKIELSAQLKVATTIQVRLIDQSGRTFYQQRINGQAGENSIRIADLGSIKPGVYILELSADNEVVREKIVKQ